jgi:hypothetical protein
MQNMEGSGRGRTADLRFEDWWMRGRDLVLRAMRTVRNVCVRDHTAFPGGRGGFLRLLRIRSTVN